MQMNGPVEIYVRRSGDRTLLNFHFTDEDDVIDLIARSRVGNLPGDPAPFAHVELSVAPEWCSDPEQRKVIEALEVPLHLRIPITQINL